MGKPIKINKSICVYLTEENYSKLLVDIKNTTCRSVSEYCRKMITGMPITVYYRNRSLDEFTEAAIRWKKDLEQVLVMANPSDTEREWLTREIVTIKDLLSNIYDDVRKNKEIC